MSYWCLVLFAYSLMNLNFNNIVTVHSKIGISMISTMWMTSSSSTTAPLVVSGGSCQLVPRVNDHGDPKFPKDRVVGPLPNSLCKWLLIGGDPNYSLSGMILQVGTQDKLIGSNDDAIVSSYGPQWLNLNQKTPGWRRKNIAIDDFGNLWRIFAVAGGWSGLPTGKKRLVLKTICSTRSLGNWSDLTNIYVSIRLEWFGTDNCKNDRKAL